ncbi:MAG TPA: hypothetical protein VF166_11165 [Gemmatimonadaceae bacterium]
MYATIRRYSYERGDVHELSRQIQQGFVPIVSKLPGFVAYYVVNSGMSTLSTISIFESREGADQSVRAAADWVGQNLAEAGLSRPQITAGDVTVHKLAEHPAGAAYTQ